MYCSSCGGAVTQSLIYCNHCGARLKAEKVDSLVKTTEARADGMIMSAMVGLFILSLPAICLLIVVMRNGLGLNKGEILPFVILSFIIMLLLEGVLLWQLSFRKRGTEGLGGTERVKGQTTKELNEAKARMLPGQPLSVTEHTTNLLETADKDRQM
ncbi:MAG TPA: zinc ribbon domain-containing protein [Blastocatellia bacterium]|jgi:hypothetical protein|nr:zinc ribbon domain-containing protein [Blastocatellia bacterium]